MSAPESGYAFPWEREAMRGAEMPDGLPLYDQMAYISLRTLYHDYHEKRLDRKTASEEKRRILGARDKAKQAAEFERNLAFFQARVYKDSERAVTAVRKNPSPENAIRLCNVLDGLERYRPEDAAPYGVDDDPEIKTNADRIRDMSDEELAIWIDEWSFCTNVCPSSANAEKTIGYHCPGNCKEQALKWLRQTAT